MDTNLFRVSKSYWAVKSSHNPEVQTFLTIESAATYLESVGIPDKEIDFALVDMIANETSRANFGVTQGTFQFSDNKGLDELFGIA